MVVYRLLGPLEAVLDGSPLALGNGTQRELFALLLLDANRTVPVERLIDSLWDDPPASAPKIIQNCVVRLRRVLPDRSLITRPHGYELRLDGAETDLAQFSELVDRALRVSEPKETAPLLAQALALWRGPALGDVRLSTALRLEAERLDELHLRALADRIDADLALGRHEQVVGELTRLVASHPLRERLRAQLMLALYRSGRQADALETYRTGRAELVEQLGVEPGPELKQLEQAILRHDPVVAAPGESNPRPTADVGPPTVPRRLMLAVACTAIVVLAAVSSFVLTRGTGSLAVDHLIVVNAANGHVVGHVPTGAGPVDIAFAGGTAFLLDSVGTVNAIERQTLAVEPKSIGVAMHDVNGLTSIAAAGGQVWTVDGNDGALTSISLPFDGAFAHIPFLRSYPIDDYITLTSGKHTLWATSAARQAVIAFDPETDRITSQTHVPGRPIAVVTGANAVWCISSGTRLSTLTRIDPTTRRTVDITLPGLPSSLTFGLGSVWVAVPTGNIVLRIDPATNAIARTFEIGNLPQSVAIARGRLWVGTAGNDELLSFNPATGNETSTLHLHRLPEKIAAAGDQIWVLTS